MSGSRRIRLSVDEFEKLVDEALASLPAQFRPYLDNVTVEILPRPDRQMLESVGEEDPTALLGLYEGTSMLDRSVTDLARLPDRILLFQRNIEAICETREDVVEEVRTTVLHEVGHHLGMTEDELEELGYD